MHLINGAQFLNVSSLSLYPSACLSPALSPSPVIVIAPLKSMYESAQSHRLDLNIVVLI